MTTKKKRKPTKHACFECNGTGDICNVCGEARGACKCPEDEQDWHDCEGCNGTGEG